MSAAGGHWLAPLRRSRAGAAHRRRQTPCQDSALSGSARSRDGVTVQLMAVADGHGGSAYWLSDVGSRLACSLALEVAAEGIAARCLGQPLDNRSRDDLTHWLSLELPAQLLQRWQAAVSADWQQRPEAEGQGAGPATRPYGTTLGLVLLTPWWWAHTGLGDWDLVLLEPGQDRLVSQEPAAIGRGEATASLCLSDAARHFSERCGLQALPPAHGGPFSLVLSTDGIRKSCATDADHLALCRFLAEESAALSAAGEQGETDGLDTGLDRISREGSGDDVSVAIAHYRPANASSGAAAPEPGSAAAGPRGGAVLAGVLLGSGLLAVLGAAVMLWRWPQPKPEQAPEPQPEPIPLALQQSELQQIVQELCANPERIEATLNQRKALFERLAPLPPGAATGQGSIRSTAAAGNSLGPAASGGEADGPAASGGQADRTAGAGGDALSELIRRSQPGAAPPNALPTLCPPLQAALQRRWSALQPPPPPGPARPSSARPPANDV